MMNKKLFLIVLFGLFPAKAIFAQDTAITQIKPAIISASNYITKNNCVGLGDYLELSVKNLGGLLAAANNRNSSFVLYLNDIPLRGISPTNIDINKEIIVFQLTRNDSSKLFWNLLYNKSDRKSIKAMDVGIGINDKGAMKGSAGKINVQLYSKSRSVLVSVCLGIAIILFLLLAFYTDIVRDGKSESKTIRASYSLSKCQLAWWTLIIFCSVGYIFSITGELPTITSQALILLGISMGTTAAATIINASGETQKPNKHQGFWFIDLLWDNNAISIHRFQMVIWTIFLGVYFLIRARDNLNIPELGSDLLTLMGISSGAYIGLKIPEDKTPPKA
jgi:hypothetical protein